MHGWYRNLVHPETDAEGRITRPFEVGTTNFLVAMAPLAGGAVARLVTLRDHLDTVAWWAFAAVPVGVAAVTFAHAYLGSVVGGRRANNIFRLVLAGVLVGAVWFLARSMRAGFGM